MVTKRYSAPWSVYATGWSHRPGSFRLGIGSFIEDSGNKVQVIEQVDDGADLEVVAEIEHQYPVTKLMWAPGQVSTSQGTPGDSDLFATTGDYFRLYEMVEDEGGGGGDAEGGEGGTIHATAGARRRRREVRCKATLSNVRKTGASKRDYGPPLTSFDWNEMDPTLCVTSSIDTTCTVWDIKTQQAKTQLIAHDKEVYDVAFARGTEVFASVGADGSVRMFDLRALDHSTIIYETQGVVVPAPRPVSTTSSLSSSHPASHASSSQQPHPPPPSTTANAAAAAAATPTSTTSTNADPNLTVESPALLRLSWNKQDPNYLSAIQIGAASVLILDIRVPAVPVVELVGHEAPVNAISWAPHSSAHICTAGSDGQALIWDISQMSKSRSMHDPILGFYAGRSINNLTWSSSNSDWVALAAGEVVRTLKV
ncbi:ddb1 and cul4 associated factor 7 [Phlyctochytrium bullatum]|nr:ddb1 and cul4 associated factor 7 [Phlyctochytrium bullatum]